MLNNPEQFESESKNAKIFDNDSEGERIPEKEIAFDGGERDEIVKAKEKEKDERGKREVREVINGIMSENKEISELRSEGEKIYEKDFTGKLDEVLKYEFKSEDGEEPVVLKNIVEKYSNLASSSLSSEKNREDFVKDLVDQMSKIPADSWSINFNHALEKGKLNCSNSASLAGLILEKNKEKFGIESIEYGSPYGHAIDIVTFSDGKVYYVDPRNNVFENLDLGKNTEIKEENGLRVYKIKELKGKMGYKIIPALNLKDGILGAYLGNLNSAYHSGKGEIPDVIKSESKKEQEKFIKGAKIVAEEKGLSDEKKRLYFNKISNIFAGKLDEYYKTPEFESEEKRWQEEEKFTKGLEPMRELIRKDKKVRQEIIDDKEKIVSFLNYNVNELSLENKKAEKILKKFRADQYGFRNKKPSEYKEYIRHIKEWLK